eukprot:3251295-Pleurochrysis_carterae.AAC.3
MFRSGSRSVEIRQPLCRSCARCAYPFSLRVTCWSKSNGALHFADTSSRIKGYFRHLGTYLRGEYYLYKSTPQSLLTVVC